MNSSFFAVATSTPCAGHTSSLNISHTAKPLSSLVMRRQEAARVGRTCTNPECHHALHVFYLYINNITPSLAACDSVGAISSQTCLWSGLHSGQTPQRQCRGLTFIPQKINNVGIHVGWHQISVGACFWWDSKFGMKKESYLHYGLLV